MEAEEKKHLDKAKLYTNLAYVMTLYAPEGYKPKENCNGCGSGWNAKIVPDTIYGMGIS